MGWKYFFSSWFNCSIYHINCLNNVHTSIQFQLTQLKYICKRDVTINVLTNVSKSSVVLPFSVYRKFGSVLFSVTILWLCYLFLLLAFIILRYVIVVTVKIKPCSKDL